MDDKRYNSCVKRCTIDDIEDVERILKAPEIYPNITDDGSLPIEEFTVKLALESELNYFLILNKDILVIMHPINSITYDCHVNILNSGRNENSIKEAREKILYFIFNETPCQKMIAFIPSKYQNVMRFATRIGMRLEGVSTESYLKDGILYDQYLYGLTKGEYKKWEKQQEPL